MRMKISIRQATELDIPGVQELYVQWVAAGITHGLIEPEPDYFSDRLGPLFIVAERDNAIIGFAIGTEHTSDGLAVIPEGDRYLEIDDIYVTPEHQSSGVGSLLLQEIEDRARSTGIHRFLVYSASQDVDGILSFYRTRGYKPWYVHMFK